MSAMPEAWFDRAIAVGLARLAVLGLPGTPIDEPSSAACRAVWVDALWPGRAWDRAQDEPRIEAAFRRLALDVTRWPAPRQFLDALPARPEPTKLPPPKMTEEERAKARAMLAGLVQKLRMP